MNLGTRPLQAEPSPCESLGGNRKWPMSAVSSGRKCISWWALVCLFNNLISNLNLLIICIVDLRDMYLYSP